MAPDDGSGAAPMLEMLGISKAYGTVQANRGVDLTVRRGEILGLLGENGSGKSTLMKILFGMVRPDDGRIVLKGQRVEIRSPADARRAGIGMVHQHFMLAEAMSVLDNVLLGLPGKGAWPDRRAAAEELARASRAYGLDLDPDAAVESLSFGMRQRVEIVKLILGGAELLIMDEPTSNLSAPEVGALLAILRRFAGEGRSVVFISHKLGEVLELCDQVVVLRDGAVAGRRPVAGTDRADLARLMVGRAMPAVPAAPAGPPGPVRLAADSLTTGGPGIALSAVSLDIRAGEVLAVAGIDGNGQTELAEALAGLRPARGRVRLDAEDLTGRGPAARLAAGLAYVPVDRGGTSLVPGMTVAENLALRDVARPPFSRRAWLDGEAFRERARERIAAYGIRCAGPAAPARSLSGGNQQKIVIAREIGRGPRALVAVQPTWGLDPGATRFVQDAIRALRAAGGAILYVSAELEEVLEMGDRVAVLHAGRLSRPVRRAQLDLVRVGLLMAGDRDAWAPEAERLAA
ncbi:ABC transporter ATP-binding protein [Methylobacterium nonmethylotrophicum]|uniref:ABC transporter ATP-binding protein n=1 Tax=Methylobacterium nonmethylotrophicum TaxID=1141884 RepID=A0A4Z0NKN7_9HYPH|nr:ABC transporter ATP-binding protein [Methylobacterium nonmethylotrophicum]TGD96336.1 ABC transporter ATP-binding protein [Methylobacterium nonmethylotrophicum]